MPTTAPSRRGYRLNSLTLKQKAQIVEEYRRREKDGLSTSQKELAVWAQQKFRLSSPPSQPVLYRILSAPSALTIHTTGLSKRNRRGKHPELETSLALWVRAQHDAGVCLNGDMIKLQGRRIVDGVNDKLGVEDQIYFHFSSGWLGNFQKRWGLKLIKPHGESNDADDNEIVRSLPILQEKLKHYNINDIWNADETGLNYRLAPCKTIAHEQMSGRKKDKVRLTYLLCANADGTEQFPLMVIGKAKKPRCFRQKTGQELGFDYWNNTKAWMRTDIFFLWLHRFDAYIGTTRNRQVILRLDNASPHGTSDTLPELKNVEVAFLPANTTSKLQRMDAGIIAAFKKRYRKMQYSRALDYIDGGVQSIYSVDQLTAMRWTARIWDELPGTIILNCRRTTKLLDEKLNDANSRQDNVDHTTETDLENLMTALAPAASRMTIANLLNRDDEEPCVQQLSIQNLVNDAVGMIGERDRSDGVHADTDADADCFVELPSITEQLRALSITKKILEDAETVDRSAMRAVIHAQIKLRQQKAVSMKQSRISDFFNNN